MNGHGVSPAESKGVWLPTDWRDEWQGIVEAVGTDFSDGQVRYGAETVERSTIRRYLEPLEFDCPLHYDTEVARRYGYPDIIAPYTAIVTWSNPPMWVPGEPPVFTDSRRDAQPDRAPSGQAPASPAPWAVGYFATDLSLDFLRPITLGDRVGRRGHWLLEASLKETSVGRGAFTTWGTEIVDAREEVVMRLRTGTYAYEPHPVTRSRPQVASSGADRRESPDEIPVVSASSGTERHIGDVEVGQVLSPVAFPLTVYRLIVEAGANRDFNSIHHNTQWAQATGAPDMYANNSFLCAMWERAVRDWMGPGGTIVSIHDFRMRSFNYVGETTVVRGAVAAVDRDAGVVTLEMRSETRQGISVGPGTVTVTLPS
jgi:N-terminal half of MaoC dehydratase